MSRTGKERSALSIAAMAMGAAIIPLVAGVGLTLKLTDQALTGENLRIGRAAVETVDRILGTAAETADSLAPMLGKRCQGILDALREAVASDPWLRSAALTYQGKPYCDTLAGSVGTLPTAASGAAGQAPGNYTLELQGPQERSGHYGQMTVTGSGERYAVAVRIDNRLLIEQLELISASADVALRVAGTYLWDDGSLLRGELRQNPRYRVLVPSSQFDYAIHSSLSGEDVLNLVTNKLILVLGPVMMLSIFTGGTCHWLLTRGRRNP